MQSVLLYLTTLLFAALAEMLYFAFLGPLCRRRTWLQFLFGMLVCLLVAWPATLLTLQAVTIAARTGSSGPSLGHFTVFFFFAVYALAWTAGRSTLAYGFHRHLLRRQKRRAAAGAPAQREGGSLLAGQFPLPRFLYPGELSRLLRRKGNNRAVKSEEPSPHAIALEERTGGLLPPCAASSPPPVAMSASVPPPAEQSAEGLLRRCDPPAKASWPGILKTGCWLLLLCFVLEITLFHYRSYRPWLAGVDPISYPLRGATLERGVRRTDGWLEVEKEGAAIVLTDIHAPVVSVAFDVGNGSESFQLKLGITDDSYSEGTRWVGPHLLARGGELSRVLSLVSNGELHKLSISFEEGCEGLTIYRILLNASPPFVFSFLRVFALFLPLMGGVILRRRKLWQAVYRPGSRRQNAVTLLAVLLLALLCGRYCVTNLSDRALSDGSGLFLEYDPETAPSNSDAYVQMFDALQKGRLSLDLDGKAQLLEPLDNPYDPSQRNEAAVSFSFDRAYYDGKYYSYFGLAPLFTVYYPIYLLTGLLPRTQLACSLLGGVYFAALAFLLRQAAALLWKKRPLGYLTWLGSYLAAAGASTILFDVRSGNYYYLAQISAMTFFILFLGLAFAGFNASRRRWLWMLGAGVSFALAAASRPNWLLYGLIALPVLLAPFFLKPRPFPGRELWQSAAAFALPVLAGGGLLALYNHLRFGSPLDFGSSWQLTVSDIRYNSLSRLENLAPALYHYFLQPFTIHGTFPFVKTTGCFQLLEQNYYFNFASAGALAYPYIWLALALPVLARRKTALPDPIAPVRRWIYGLTLALPLGMAYFSFSYAGSLFRYTGDVLPIVALAACFAAWELDTLARTKAPAILPYLVRGMLLLAGVTLLIGILLGVNGEYSTFFKQRPGDYLDLRHILEWWM